MRQKLSAFLNSAGGLLRGFFRLTIQKRLALLVLLALLPAVALFVIKNWQAETIARQIDSDKALVRLENALDAYSFAVENVHVLFLDYAYTGLDDRAQRLTSGIDRMAISFQSALTRDVNGIAARLLDPVSAFNMTLRKDAKAVIALHKSAGRESAGGNSGKLAALLDASMKLEGTLRRITMSNAGAVNAIKASAVVASLRRHQARFAASFDQMVDGEHLGQLNRLTQMIPAIETDDATRTRLADDAASYQAAFESWKTDGLALRTSIETIDRSFTNVGPVIEEARKAIRTTRDAEEISSTALVKQANQLAILLASGSVLLVLLIASIMARNLSSPLMQIRTAMNRIADGDGTLVIRHERRTDEIGEMSRALSRLRNAVAEREHMAQANERDAARTAERGSKVEAAATDFRRSINDASSRLNDASAALNTASDQMRMGAQDLAARARSSGAAAEGTRNKAIHVASATEQMSSSGREIAAQIGRSAEVATRSAEQAIETRDALTTLTDSTTRVSEVISLISRIAQQTNLLALNATIEAARAGEAGRGFAVVAAEVKTLATETAKAADEIARTVGNMHEASSEAIMSFDMLMSGIGQLRDAATAIAAAADEQEQSISSIAETMGSLTGDAEIGAMAANEAERSVHATSDIAASMDSLSADLTEIIVQLEEDVRGFVERLHAA